MVSQELLNELNTILREDYRLELNPEAVSEIGNNLVQFFELLMKIDYEARSKNAEIDYQRKESVNG